MTLAEGSTKVKVKVRGELLLAAVGDDLSTPLRPPGDTGGWWDCKRLVAIGDAGCLAIDEDSE